MKKKIISFFLACFIFISSSVSSFANPLAAATISYESLMALMALGTAFGLALPQDDDQYWDYTKNLRKHLQLVDDEYLEALGKSYIEFKRRPPNNNNDDEPWMIPYVPGVGELFDKVVDGLIKEPTAYHSHFLEPIPVGATEPLHYYNLDLSVEEKPVNLRFWFDNKVGNTSYASVDVYRVGTTYIKYDVTLRSDDGFETFSSNSSSFNYGKNYNVDVGFYFDSAYKPYIRFVNPNAGKSTSFYKNSFGNYGYAMPGKIYNPIPHGPTLPNIVGNQVEVPAERFNELPSFDSLPNNLPEHITKPLEVRPPVSDPVAPPNSDPVAPPNSEPVSPPSGEPVGETVWDKVTNFVTELVVPPSDYLTNKFQEKLESAQNKLPFLDFSPLLKLACGETPFPNIDIKIMGTPLSRILDSDRTLNAVVGFFRPLIQAFVSVFLLLYTYNQVVYLIRGSYPIKIGRDKE